MNADDREFGSRLPADQTPLIVEVFRMLADATRVQVLWALATHGDRRTDAHSHDGVTHTRA